MKQNLKDFLFNLLVSMFIGLFVGMVEITIINMNGKTVEELIMCTIIGGVIGTISRFVFIYVFEIKQKNVKMAFMSVFIIIGVISCTPSLYDYFKDGISISIVELVSVLVTAELLGMSFCYYSYKRYLAFNLKLISKKRQLMKKS
jgi:hypothetical protein